MFRWVSFTLCVPRTLSEQMGDSRRVTSHPVYFGAPILQQPGIWEERNGAMSEYKLAPVARASTYLFLAVPWCCVIGGAVTSHSLPFSKAWHYRWLTESGGSGWARLNIYRLKESCRVTCTAVRVMKATVKYGIRSDLHCPLEKYEPLLHCACKWASRLSLYISMTLKTLLPRQL